MFLPNKPFRQQKYVLTAYKHLFIPSNKKDTKEGKVPSEWTCKWALVIPTASLFFERKRHFSK